MIKKPIFESVMQGWESHPRRSSQLRKIAGYLCFTIVIALTGAHIPFVPNPINLPTATCFLVMGLFTFGWKKSQPLIKIVAVPSFVVFTIYIFQIIPVSNPYLGLLLILLFITLIFEIDTEIVPVLHLLIGVISVLTLITSIGFIANLLNDISKQFTQEITNLIDHPLRLGTNYSVLPEFIALFIISFLGVHGEIQRRVLTKRLLLLFLWFGGILLLPLFFHSDSFYQYFSLRISLYLILLTGLGFFATERIISGGINNAKRITLAFSQTLGASVAISCLILALIVGFRDTTKGLSGESVYILAGGDGYIQELPKSGVYGLQSGGMFGAFHEYLVALNLRKIEVSPEVPNFNSPESPTLLIMINTNPLPDSSLYENIRSFVRQGGGLLVLGDHTGLFQLDETYNSLLSNLGLSFNYDTAEPFSGWHGMIMRSPLFWPLWIDEPNSSDFGISIGASLDIGFPWEPLLMATGGFSDPGNPNYRTGAFLGDRRLSIGDEAGNLVLAATRAYGKGRIIVFGDTSTFQTSSVAYHYPLIYRLLSLLAVGGKYPETLLYCLFVIINLCIFYFLRNYGYIRINNYVFVGVLLILILSLYISIRKQYTNITLNKNICEIDITDHNSTSMISPGFNSIIPLVFASHRSGYFPIIKHRNVKLSIVTTDELLLVSPSPMNISYKKQEYFLDKVQKGATWIIFIGRNANRKIPMISNRFKLNFSNIEYGAVGPQENTLGIQLSRCFTMSLDPLISFNQVEYIYSDKAFFIKKAVEKGHIIIITDPQFYRPFNTEDYENALTINAKFLEELFAGTLK